MTRVLVTGARGFCGRPLVRRLREAGHIVVGVDRKPTECSEDVQQDVLSESLDSLVSSGRPEWVFHLAGVNQGSHVEQTEGNLLASLRLLEAVRRHAPKARVLLMGSAAEYGHGGGALAEDERCTPRGPYGTTKHAMTLAALDYHSCYSTDVIVARLFNAIGVGIPATLVVGAILERAHAALAAGLTEVRVGNVSTVRDFVEVNEVARALVLAMERCPGGEVVNVCSGEPIEVGLLLNALLQHSPQSLRLVSDPALVRQSDIQVAVGDPSKAERLMGFRARVSPFDVLGSLWG